MGTVGETELGDLRGPADSSRLAPLEPFEPLHGDQPVCGPGAVCPGSSKCREEFQA